MAYQKPTVVSLFPRLLALTLLLAVAVETVAAAGRNIPTKNSNDNVDMKQPQWFFDHDGSFLIPGIGRVMVPPKFQHPVPSFPPQYGGNGPVAGGGGGSYIPGGDDTLIPNPGAEVPNPVGGANPSPP